MRPRKNVYYFYTGFEEPYIINMDDIILMSSYEGDVSEMMLEDHEQQYNESDKHYNVIMGSYGVWRNPSLKEFQEFNESVGLDIDDYLNNFMSVII